MGYARRLARVSELVPTPLRDHVSSLKSGFGAGLDAVHYVSETVGIGGKYTFFSASQRTEYAGGVIDERIRMHYVGPLLSFRAIPVTHGNRVVSNFSLGYLHYSDQLSEEATQLTGRTLGVYLDVGYDIALTQHVLLGFQLALTGGTLTKIEMNNGFSKRTIELEENAYEGLGRIDLSVGLRFSH